MRVNSKKMFLTLKKEASYKTRQHQSYLELKKDTNEEFARKTILYNLESLKNNVRVTARTMKCSAHTVYLALEKQKKGNLKDSSHKPKSKHPRYIEEEKEQIIIEYGKKSKLGKRRLRYYIFQKQGTDIAESTIGKVIKRAWEELGINVIYAESPQAKGRIERLWGTFQDRLISELRLEGICSLEEANEYLHTVFLPKYNKKFTRKPKAEESAYRIIPQGMDLDQILCIKEKRRVQKDNTINYKARKYQTLPTETRFGFAKARVELQKHLDGTIHIFYKGQELPFKPIIPEEDERYAPSQRETLAVGV